MFGGRGFGRMGASTSSRLYWLPAGATLYADVSNGRYYAAGAVQPDFATWLSAASGSFTGPANRSYFNASGLMAFVSSNMPRLNYVGGVPYFLYEPAATNLLLQSGQLVSPWTNDGVTVITAGQYVDPTGGNGMAQVKPTTVNNAHDFNQAGISFNNSPYTLSAWFRYDTLRWLGANLGSGVNPGASFDLLNGVVGTSTAGVTSAIQSFGAGLYRAQVTLTPAAGSGAARFWLNDADISTTSFRLWTPTGNEKVGAWGLQLEAGTVATSLIPTTTSTVTRAAESITGLSAPGNLTVTFDDNSTQVISAANFATPANLNRTLIQKIAA